MKLLHATQTVKLCAVLAMLSGAIEYEVPQDSSKTSLSTQTSLCSLVIVSTLDGKLTALDAKNGGTERWSLPSFSGPLLSSSLSSFQKAKQVRLIPSLDGGLYQVNGDNIEAIPYNAENLLGSFHELPDGSILVGGKEAISCGIDFHTGKVRYVCSADGCNLTESEGSVQDVDIFVLKRTQQTIRAVDQRTGSERWNFSVGQQDISFLEGIVEQFNSDRKCPAADGVVYPEWNLRVSIPEGAIAAVRNQGPMSGEFVLWSHKFDSSIAAVWTFGGGHVQPVNLFSEDVMPLIDGDSALPQPQEFKRKAFMYLGNHNGQLYIHPSQPEDPSVDATAVVSLSDSKDIVKRTRPTTWRPLLASSPSRTPTVVSKELAVWNPLEYPYDNGYYLCGNVMPVIPSHGKVDSLEEENVTRKPQTVLQTPANSRNPMWNWWKAAMLIFIIVTAVMRVMLRYWRPTKRELSTATKKAIDYQRIPSSTITSCISSTSTETLNASQSSSLPLTPVTLNPSDSFISRYLSDFEHEQCLGRGGFGLVFQARNKVDDCQYAIKRVRLPNCDEAREKVMREVKALAKLEHAGIVRYFNAWFEAPPAGWQEQFDKWMIERGVYCGDVCGSDQMTEASSDNNFYRQKFSNDSVGSGNVIRRRKKTNSSTKSRHSSQTSSIADDPVGRRSTLVALDDDSDIPPLEIHQLENDAFVSEHDDSESFGIEFASSSRTGDLVLKSGSISDFDESESQSIIFADSGVSDGTGGCVPFEERADLSAISSSSSHSASGGSFKQEISFSSANQSLLQGKQHKCQSKKCTADILEAPLYLYIQMQLCQRNSLKDWLRDNKNRDHVFCLNVFEQIVSAVEYFHGSGMMHRDLKPSNIFFSLDGSVKVGDFGLVTATVHDSTVESPYKGKNGYTDVNHTGKVGTHLYMSPEQMEGKSYSHKVDVYSLGIIFFELFYSFGTQMERIMVMSDVKAKKFPESFKVSMPLQAEFISWLLSDTPKARPNATQIKRSEILRKITQQAHESTNLVSE